MSGMYTMPPLTQVLREAARSETGEKKGKEGERQGQYCMLLIKQVLETEKIREEVYASVFWSNKYSHLSEVTG